jgi:hypothetical protein
VDGGRNEADWMRASAANRAVMLVRDSAHAVILVRDFASTVPYATRRTQFICTYVQYPHIEQQVLYVWPAIYKPRTALKLDTDVAGVANLEVHKRNVDPHPSVIRALCLQLG